jgi:hypothetical protein
VVLMTARELSLLLLLLMMMTWLAQLPVMGQPLLCWAPAGAPPLLCWAPVRLWDLQPLAHPLRHPMTLARVLLMTAAPAAAAVAAAAAAAAAVKRRLRLRALPSRAALQWAPQEVLLHWPSLLLLGRAP